MDRLPKPKNKLAAITSLRRKTSTKPFRSPPGFRERNAAVSKSVPSPTMPRRSPLGWSSALRLLCLLLLKFLDPCVPFTPSKRRKRRISTFNLHSCPDLHPLLISAILLVAQLENLRHHPCFQRRTASWRNAAPHQRRCNHLSEARLGNRSNRLR